MQAVHLDSSLIFVPPAMVRQQRESDVIGSDVFAAADQHIILRDRKLASSLRDFAMREGMAIAKVRVGTNGESTPVEFFWMDVKRNKRDFAKLSKLLSRRWVEVIYEAELAREDAAGNFLASGVTGAMSAVEEVLNVRRFLANGTDPAVLSKKKRTVLLFHHTRANAPHPE